MHEDADAFARLVETYLPRVYTFLARLTGDRALAEDATQETFIKAWRRWDSYDREKPLLPWLFQIARHSALDILRKRRALPFSETQDDIAENLADPDPLPDELFEQKELGAMVGRALATLPERDRAVLLLHYADNLTFEEVGEVMDAPTNTVKSWHQRAILKLRALIAPKYE